MSYALRIVTGQDVSHERGATPREEEYITALAAARMAKGEWEERTKLLDRALREALGQPSKTGAEWEGTSILLRPGGGRLQVVQSRSAVSCDLDALFKAHPEIIGYCQPYLKGGAPYFYCKVTG